MWHGSYIKFNVTCNIRGMTMLRIQLESVQCYLFGDTHISHCKDKRTWEM